MMILSNSLTFQSTPSAWRETTYPFSSILDHLISIHSLRMEGDRFLGNIRPFRVHFNPLPPHGGRPGKKRTSSGEKRFQSTPSAWRETRCRCRSKCRTAFQSTPSAWRETQHLGRRFIVYKYFNPLPPHGGRRILWRYSVGIPEFQSTPSAWRETHFGFKISSNLIFQSTPSAWRETKTCPARSGSGLYFNPLPPHGGRL